MKQILCALRLPSDHLLQTLYIQSQKYGWQLECCGERIPQNWSGDGVISDFFSLEQLKQIKNFDNTPIVSRELNPKKNIRCVCCDTEKLAKLVVDYFATKGFLNYALAAERLWPGGNPEKPHDSNRAIISELQKRKFNCFSCWWNPGLMPNASEDYEKSLQKLRIFFLNVPKPIALYLSSPRHLPRIYRILAELQLSVPKDIAVLCNTDAPLPQEYAVIPTSCVVGELMDAGVMLTETLNRMLHNELISEEFIYTSPHRIYSRLSTDTLAVPHPQLRSAVDFIKRNCGANIGIETTASTIGLSRAGLDRLFRTYLNCTPRAFLIQQRLEKACQILSETDLPIKEIAPLCGYGSSLALYNAFRSYYGVPPGAYRKHRQKNETNKASG